MDKVIFAKHNTDALLSAFPKGIIFLDLETTGLSPLMDSIIELSAIKITPEGITTFDELIDPKKLIPEFTIKIHGITDEMVKGKPVISEVLPKFVEFCGNLPLGAHNSKFDIGFILFSLYSNNLPSWKAPVYCSCQYARKALKHLPKFNLASLVENLNIKLENHHRALDDAIACAEVFAHGIIYQNKEYNKSNLPYGYMFNLSEFDKNKVIDIPSKITGLKDYLADQKLVEIKYTGGSHRNEWRPVRPISLLPMPSGNVLYARCLLSDHFKSFAIKKIKVFRDACDDVKEKYDTVF